MAYESDADEREQDEDMEVDEAYDVRFCPSSRTDQCIMAHREPLTWNRKI